MRGSAAIAVSIDNRPFDKLIFVEKEQKRCDELENLKKEHRQRYSDREFGCKRVSENLQQNWKQWRGVLFLDPFATEVEWSTMEAAGFEALEHRITWILFPVSESHECCQHHSNLMRFRRNGPNGSLGFSEMRVGETSTKKTPRETCLEVSNIRESQASTASSAFTKTN